MTKNIQSYIMTQQEQIKPPSSLGCSKSQGLGCSPIKAVRELGSERRETIRSLSSVAVGYLRGAVPSRRGLGWTDLWSIGSSTKSMAK